MSETTTKGQLTYQDIKSQIKDNELVVMGAGKGATTYSINEFQKRVKQKTFDPTEVCAMNKKTLTKRNFTVPQD